MTDLINRIRQAQVIAGEQAVIAHLQEQMTELKVCHAVQMSDSMSCNRCQQLWDVNDPSPPPCNIAALVETEIEQPEEHDSIPEWATGRAKASTDFGAQLCTRDGRRCGNAVVFECAPVGEYVVKVCTDAGNVMTLSAVEIDDLFYPAKWLMDPNTAPGVIRHTIDIRNEKVKKYVEADDNGLPKDSPESDSFILEHAMNAGFEMIDDDGDVYVCNSRQVVALVKPYKDAALKCRDVLANQIVDAYRASGMTACEARTIMGGKLDDQGIEKLPGILSAMKAWRKS